MRLWRTTELSDGEVDVAKSDRETVHRRGPATAKERSPRRERVR